MVRSTSVCVSAWKNKILKYCLTDRPTRDKAVSSLRTYLSGRRTLDNSSLLKLWKGLFYCMWMSDRPRTQQRLADELADLVSVLPANNVIPFLTAFWKTMAREWTNIDVLRMEKFLLLTRRYLQATFMSLEKDNWKDEQVKTMMELLAEYPLNAKDVRIPNGMRYHVIDIYVDELEKLGVLSEDIDEETLEVLLDPLRIISVGSPTKSVRQKAQEALADERLPGNEKTVAPEDEESKEDEGWAGIED